MQGSVTKKGNRWYIRYYIGKDDSGKWRQKWEGGFNSQKEAQKMLRKRIEELENTFEHKTYNSTMEVYLRHWLDSYCRPRLSANTVNGYSVNIENHIIPYIGDIALCKLKPRDIQGLYDKLLGSGLSGTSVRYVHNNLHKALASAVKQELIPRNPADLVDPPVVNRYEALTLSPADATKLLNACVGTEIYLPVLFALLLGLRRGEALGLQWSDVDIDGKLITVRHSASFTKDGFILSTPKTKNSRRTLMLPDLVVSAMEDAKTKQDYWRENVGQGFNPYELVCCRHDGSPLTANALQRQYKDVLDALRLPSIRFHDLRHTNATLMLRNNVPAKIVSSMLGHSSIGITMDTYSHVMTDMQAEATATMNTLFENAGKGEGQLCLFPTG